MIMSKPFEFGGLHHLALVCKDMLRTVDFYTNILGMNLNKGFDLDGGYGQHFFFDMGDGQELAFFWFNDAHSAQPGVASAANLVASGNGTISSAHGSMNHLAFSVSKDKIDGYRQELVSRGVDCSEVVNHDDVITGDEKRTSDMPTDKTWLRSFYFFDPDGIMLEFCATLSQGVQVADSPVNEKGIKENGQLIMGTV